MPSTPNPRNYDCRIVGLGKAREIDEWISGKSTSLRFEQLSSAACQWVISDSPRHQHKQTSCPFLKAGKSTCPSFALDGLALIESNSSMQSASRLDFNSVWFSIARTSFEYSERSVGSLSKYANLSRVSEISRLSATMSSVTIWTKGKVAFALPIVNVFWHSTADIGWPKLIAWFRVTRTVSNTIDWKLTTKNKLSGTWIFSFRPSSLYFQYWFS